MDLDENNLLILIEKQEEIVNNLQSYYIIDDNGNIRCLKCSPLDNGTYVKICEIDSSHINRDIFFHFSHNHAILIRDKGRIANQGKTEKTEVVRLKENQFIASFQRCVNIKLNTQTDMDELNDLSIGIDFQGDKKPILVFHTPNCDCEEYYTNPH